MFSLRATQKLLNVSRLKPEAEPEIVNPIHEWYANLCSTTFKGKFVVMFVHGYSRLTVLAKGKSLLQTIDVFRERLELLLIRNGIELERRFRIIPTEEPIVLKTKSKSVLGHMNEYKHELDYKFYEYTRYEDIDLNKLEDSLSEFVVSIEGNKYYKPIDLIRNL